jgi:ABC-2 type transport system permease protein
MLNTQPSIAPAGSMPKARPSRPLLIDVEGIAMIWLRDMTRLWRQRSRLLGGIVRALVWLFALGFGLRRSIVPIEGLSYEQFVYPGIIAMTIIFTALQSAISIIWDREFGFLKEVMVAPTPRSTLILGKCLGGATSSTLQAAIILVFAPLASVRLTPLNVLEVFVAMFVTALALTALGIVIAARMTDFEGFGTLQNFITLPLYLFSGAVFPVRGAPVWLQVILYINPLTYGVNAIRGALLGYGAAEIPLDLALLGVFTVIMLSVAILITRREV